MSDIELTATEWLGLLTHIKIWLSNLRRAKQSRKFASKAALQDVIQAARRTATYDRHIKEGEIPSLPQETEQARHATSRNSGTPVALIRSPTQRMGDALNALRP